MIKELLENKTAKQKANIKGVKIAKIKSLPKTKRKDFDIEIVETKAIEGGVEVFARAWGNGEQIGFGDGSVDIERFRIFNPPILVPDEMGDVVRVQEADEQLGTERSESRYREDPQEALLQVIEQNLSVMKNVHTGKKIKKGKRGNTTSTFYPAAGATSPVDGQVERNDGACASFSALRDNSGSNASAVATSGRVGLRRHVCSGTNSFRSLGRLILLFDTSALSGNIIDSAVFSLYKTSTWTIQGGVGFNVVSASPTSDDDIVAGDYNLADSRFGSTKFSTDSAMSGTGYKDFTLNASGLSNISKTTNSKFGFRMNHDIDDTSPPNQSSDGLDIVDVSMADETGTTQDPKLVVEHSVASNPPTVTTAAVDNIQTTQADGNGEITDTGVDDPDERGFVYDTQSRSDPGNVSPAASAYPNLENETGTFGVGTFLLTLSSLTSDTTYYVRAYAHNTDGYAYGSEVSFSTLAIVFAISGVVSLSSVGVLGATVRCIRQSDNTAIAQQTTDVNGAYLFEDLEETELYHLAVEFVDGGTKYNALSLWDISPVEVV